MKRKNIAVVLITSIIIVLIALLFSFRENISEIFDSLMKNINESECSLSVKILDNQNNNNILSLITVASNDNALEYVKTPSNTKIMGNGKNSITFDCSFKKDVQYSLTMKEKGKNEKEETICINDDYIYNNFLKIDLIKNYSKAKIYEIKEQADIENYDFYYKIGTNDTWKSQEGKILSLEDQIIDKGLVNSDNTVTVSAKLQNSQNGNAIVLNKKYPVDMTDISYLKGNYSGESLLKVVEDNEYTTGLYNLNANNKTYSAKVYYFDEDIEFDNTVEFGSQTDVSTGASNYSKNMIIVKVNGNIKTNKDATLTTYSTNYGGPKGLMVYCTGSLINNGNISMTAKGAYAEGEDVYLWKNSDNSFEYIPKDGALGGASVESSYNAMNGNDGKHGIYRQTGGGASGRLWTSANRYGKTGAGALGTSYSGGSGGGGVDCGGRESGYCNLKRRRCRIKWRTWRPWRWKYCFWWRIR